MCEIRELLVRSFIIMNGISTTVPFSRITDWSYITWRFIYVTNEVILYIQPLLLNSKLMFQVNAISSNTHHVMSASQVCAPVSSFGPFLTLIPVSSKRDWPKQRTFLRLRWPSGSHADLWFPSSRVQTRPKPLDFFCVKNPQHAFLRRGS
jgi:hypothetical protein